HRAGVRLGGEQRGEEREQDRAPGCAGGADHSGPRVSGPARRGRGNRLGGGRPFGRGLRNLTHPEPSGRSVSAPDDTVPWCPPPSTPRSEHGSNGASLTGPRSPRPWGGARSNHVRTEIGRAHV